MSTQSEIETFRAFILPNMRDRYVEMVSSSRNRQKLIDELAHFGHFDPRFRLPLESKKLFPAGIETVLRAKGAGSTCWVISEDRSIDGREIGLAEALKEVVGNQMGTVLICIPGRLAFVETEDERYVLFRPEPKR